MCVSQNIDISDEEMERTIDLRPYMNEGSYTVSDVSI